MRRPDIILDLSEIHKQWDETNRLLGSLSNGINRVANIMADQAKKNDDNLRSKGRQESNMD